MQVSSYLLLYSSVDYCDVGKGVVLSFWSVPVWLNTMYRIMFHSCISDEFLAIEMLYIFRDRALLFHH